MTEIAVLLPCYNPPPDELAGTLASLREQGEPFRLFLVDDGSRKHTDYEAFTQGMNAEIIRLPQNLGITGAMNAGLDRIMAGPYRYIARIDCGDFCMPQRFTLQKRYLDAHPEVGILGSAVQLRLLDASGKLVGTRDMTFPRTHADCVRRLYLNTAIIHPAMMIRREVFEKIKHYSEEYPAAEDYELQWRTAANGFKILNLPETLLVKEETPGSISQMRRRKQIYNRMRIQWHNRRITSALSWIGLGKSLATWLAPAWAVNGVKFVLGGKK